MSHTLAARCNVCGVVDDDICPECGTPSAATHGTSNQEPWSHVATDGYVHEWHPACADHRTAETDPTTASEQGDQSA